jgi:hypothetical protein
MKKCGTAALGCSIDEQARVPAPHYPGVFHAKASGYILEYFRDWKNFWFGYDRNRGE